MTIVTSSTKLRTTSKALLRVTKMRMRRKTIAELYVLAGDFLLEAPLLPVAMPPGYVIDVSHGQQTKMEKDHLK
ncbi:hypothetical protein KB1_24520 [Cutibacterium modestum]|uniref:Uncharacterized protein n=1 Tax=Cutibacterium modestum TaxID=2559073 RepID=A0AAD1KRN2_9ACTN|nr:hypothetical protein [Cutibacterium modestum 31N]BCY26462.1 hypothetical protein KB1_24520 [Cutibacterium modestum]